MSVDVSRGGSVDSGVHLGVHNPRTVEHSLGTLEAGKIADLVLVDGDPLENLAALGDVVMVVKDGAVAVDNR